MKIIMETGNITVVALMILVILTLIGISAGRTSNTDVIAARNLIPHKQDFYIAEAGQNMEAIKIGRGDYPVIESDNPGLVLAESSEEVVPGDLCDYRVTYQGHFSPPKGYSAIHFTRYDYEVLTKSGKNISNDVKINARYYSIGPKME
jgi:Tfp pilus assembly protein PilX